MNPLEQLTVLFAGQTLATLREEAKKEFNGTATKAVRAEGGRRTVLFICVTGEHELALLDKRLYAENKVEFKEWSRWPLLVVMARILSVGGYGYCMEAGAVILIAAVPDSIRRLESDFNLSP